MQLSARNQLKAKDAADDLGFAVGDDVIVVIKSTDVMLAKD